MTKKSNFIKVVAILIVVLLAVISFLTYLNYAKSALPEVNEESLNLTSARILCDTACTPAVSLLDKGLRSQCASAQNLNVKNKVRICILDAVEKLCECAYNSQARLASCESGFETASDSCLIES